MKLYLIRNWDELYENHKTRILKKLDWVAVPNRQDGDGYTALIEQPNGPAMFGAFMAILQVASRCEPRGMLIRDNRQPHTPETLARMTRFPVQTILDTLQVLSTDPHDWIEARDNTIPPAGAVTTSQQPPPPSKIIPAHEAAVDPAVELAYDPAMNERKKEGNEQKERMEGSGALSNFATLRVQLNALYNRDDMDRWGAAEEQALLEIADRANALAELEALASYRARLPFKERKFFPNSIYTLLSGWTTTLDKARADNSPRLLQDKTAASAVDEANRL